MPGKLLLLLLFASLSCAAAELTGVWKQLDDDGKPASFVRIYEQGGAFEGKVERIFPDPGEPDNPLCQNCRGELHNQPVIGMRIISSLKRKDARHFGDGDILDPDNGKTYRCLIELSEDATKLEVTGSIGPAWLGRTETWYRME